MKKTIIALFALAGVAAADSITLTLPEAAQLSPYTEALGTTCADIFSKVADDAYGVYYGAQGGVISPLNSDEGKWAIGGRQRARNSHLPRQKEQQKLRGFHLHA